jgi:hypothetical protein
MDESLKLHNAAIRRLAAAYRGYESQWEGDSFLIAFRHPTHAVAFALQVRMWARACACVPACAHRSLNPPARPPTHPPHPTAHPPLTHAVAFAVQGVFACASMRAWVPDCAH